MIRLNVENLIRDIRSQSDKDFSGHITDSQLTQMIERSWSSLYQEIIQNNETFYVKKTAVNIRAKDNYLPNDFLKLIGVDRYRDDKFISLDKGNFQNRQDFQYTNFDESPYGYDTDYRYTYFGNTISINSKLRDVNTNFVIYYIPEAPSVVSGNAFVQKGWEQWIIFDVSIKAKMREESEIRGLILQRGEILERIKVFADSRDFGSPPTINRVADYSDEGYDSFYPYSQDVDSTLTFDDLLVPNFNEKIPYPVEFLETYTAKALYYEFLEAENTAYIGFLNEEDESQWCVARIQNKRINYGIFSENTDHNSLEGAWADRLNLTYIQSITVITEEETVSVTPGSAEEGQMQAPHVLFGWSQDNITDVTNVDNASFVRFNSPYGSNITIPASGLSQAYFLVGVSNEGRFDQFSIGGLDQVGIFLELGVENGYRYYISENPLLPEFFGNRTVTLGISNQGIARGSVIPSEEGSAPSLGNISLKLLWSNDEGYPDIQGDSRVLAYNSDSASKTISGEFHNANDGLKVFRGDNNFWLKDEEVASNGNISSVLSEYDDSAMRTTRPALSVAGKLVDLDVSPSNELFLLQEAVGTKTERYSRYTIPESGLPTLASEINDANSGTLSRVVGGDDDVLVCRETSTTANFYAYNQSDNARASSLDFNFTKNTGESVKSMFYTGQYLNIVLSDGTNSRTVVYKREASSYVRQSSLDKTFTGVNFDNASFDNKKLFNVSGIVDDMSGGGSGGSGTTLLYGIRNDSVERRLYSIDPATGVATALSYINPTADDPTGTGDWTNLASLNQTLYSINYDNDSLYSIDPATGVATLIGSTGTARFRWEALAFIGSTLYGIADYDDKLYTINTSTGAATLVGEMNSGSSRSYRSLASVGGNLYAPNSFNGSFYSINTSTGVATELGILVDSNGSVVRIQGLTSIGTTLYGVSNDNKLYSIDPSTRIATEISSTPDDIRCLTAVTTRGGA